MRAAMILLTMASLAAAAAPTRTVVVDIQKPEAPVALTVLQGATANVAFELRQNGKPYTDLAEHTAEFAFATTLTNTPRRVDSTTTDEANGRFVFQLSDEDTASAGRFAGILLITDAQTNTFFQGRVDLSVLASAFATGAGELQTGETVNWDGTSYENTATAGPYRAGTNVTFSANGDGSVNVNASVTGGTGDITGGAVTGGLLTVGEAGGVLTFGLTTNAVRSAVSGIYLPLAGGAMTGSVDIPYGTAIRWRDSANSMWYSLAVDGDDTLSIGGNKILNESSSLEASQLIGSIAPDRVALTTSGDMLYRNTSSALARVGIGTAGQVLQSSGSAPVWATMVGLVDRDYGDVNVSASGQTWTIDSAAVTPAKMSDTARTIAVTASAWEGPTASQTPGWAPKSYAVAGLNAVVAGPVGSATQAAGTFASIFQIPSDATAWRSAKAISLSFIGDSTTSTAVKYRLRVYIAGNNTALYDVSDQVLASTSTVTTVDIAGSSLATFTADAVYTIVVDASVTTSGFYFVGQPRIQVLK